MRDNLEPSEYDINYFDDRFEKEKITPTIEQEERFLDRVWKLVEKGDSENIARRAAWYEIMGKEWH